MEENIHTLPVFFTWINVSLKNSGETSGLYIHICIYIHIHLVDFIYTYNSYNIHTFSRFLPFFLGYGKYLTIAFVPCLPSLSPSGEDAYFVDPHGMGVADGVGCMVLLMGWNGDMNASPMINWQGRNICRLPTYKSLGENLVYDSSIISEVFHWDVSYWDVQLGTGCKS